MAFRLRKLFAMVNNSTKKVVQQRQTSRSQAIEAAQVNWLVEEKRLTDDKATLGYGHISWDEFLIINLDDSLDIVRRLQIIDLQREHKELIKKRECLWIEDNVINAFNKKHAILHADQTYILTEKINSLGNKDFSLESRQSFKNYYEDEEVQCADGKWRSKADIWLKSSKRRKYDNIVFDPTTTECVNGHYNLWKGFAKVPQKGDCSKYWQHVQDNICRADEERYYYVRKWLAYVFQRPDEVHTALVLCGSQGVGKNSFVEPLGVLLGSHYAPLSSIHELVSNFNYHLKNAVLIHANEALWGGNKKEIGTVKAMITEQICLIESKGKDRITVRNFKHVILSSNEGWPVHLDTDDRRFFVINVSEKQKENHVYFKAIQEQLNHGGYEALLHNLLHDDLTDFNPRKMPFSSDSFDIKLRSADSAHRYIYEVLFEGGFSIGTLTENENPVWQGPISKNSVYGDYDVWCQKSNEVALTKGLFGKVLKKLIASVVDTRPGGECRQRYFKFPPLQEARKDFCKAFKENLERIFGEHESDNN